MMDVMRQRLQLLPNEGQPPFSSKKIGYWNPAGNAAIVPSVFGMTTLTVTGFTAVGRNVATTNMATRSRRFGYNTAGTAGSVGQFRSAAPQFTTGAVVGGVPMGGFFFSIRFTISDAAAVSGARFALGLRTDSTPANVEPSTLNNILAVGHGASDSNLMLFHGGATAQTPIDLGANFPIDGGTVNLYEFSLYAPAGILDLVHYEVKRLNTGHVATGTLSGTGVVPASNTLLCAPWGYRTNNATALAVSLDVCYIYTETDY